MLSIVFVIAYVAAPALVMVALALASCWRSLVAFSGILCLLSLGAFLSSGFFSIFGLFWLFYSFPTLVLSIMFYFISKPLPKPPAA